MTRRGTITALVYVDGNLNTIDGSSIWAVSTVETLAQAGCQVTLLLKTRVRRSALLEPLERLENVVIVRPFEDGRARGRFDDPLTVPNAVTLMRELDEASPFDLVLIRGFGLATRIVDSGAFDGRLWPYLTDLPQSATAMDEEAFDRLTAIAGASRYLLCQTEELRTFLEGAVPAACGRCVLFPPVAPEPDDPPPPSRFEPGETLKLVYSGKFAPLWNTLQMTTLPRLLAERGIKAEFHAIGDKIHQDSGDPGYQQRMMTALKSTPGVIWHGGLSRQAAMRICAEAHVGLGWRDASLDASLELSTKVLEYGTVGLPVVLNRTPMHEALLGTSYPLFAGAEAAVVDNLAWLATEPGAHGAAAATCHSAAVAYGLEGSATRVRVLLDRAFPSTARVGQRAQPLRVGVASHDLKFFDQILATLRRLPELEVRVDQWPTLATHDEAASQAMVDWADVIICEWFGPNAVWYSSHCRAGQRLVVRLHRFELYRPWPKQAKIEQVDQVICVSGHYAELVLAGTGWPAAKVTVVPNVVDDVEFDRPKLTGARFHLGFIGVAPARKRMDLAIDVLARVRRRDRRYQLFAKTKMPWEYPWIWQEADERTQFDGVLRRIQTDPDLRGAVTFDGFGPDVAAWLRRIGWVLSTSDDESFHLAPAEGMASRAVPLIRSWAGSDSIYDRRWIHDDTESMAEAILEAGEPDRWAELGRIAHDQARATFSLDRVVDAWTEILTTNLPAYEPDPPTAASPEPTGAGSAGPAG
jgi:glycosyltransferase involved in cell wall biosynthesis